MATLTLTQASSHFCPKFYIQFKILYNFTHIYSECISNTLSLKKLQSCLYFPSKEFNVFFGSVECVLFQKDGEGCLLYIISFSTCMDTLMVEKSLFINKIFYTHEFHHKDIIYLCPCYFQSSFLSHSILFRRSHVCFCIGCLRCTSSQDIPRIWILPWNCILSLQYSVIISIIIVRNPSVRKTCLFSPIYLFIYLFIYLLVIYFPKYGFIDIYFILWVMN